MLDRWGKGEKGGFVRRSFILLRTPSVRACQQQKGGNEWLPSVSLEALSWGKRNASGFFFFALCASVIGAAMAKSLPSSVTLIEKDDFKFIVMGAPSDSTLPLYVQVRAPRDGRR